MKGLSFQAYENDVQELFAPCGNILNVKLLMRDDGKSRGLAFIKFSKRSSFNKALEFDSTEQFGRNINVEESLGKKNDGGNNRQNGSGGGFKGRQPQGKIVVESPTLYIGGLSYNSTNDSVGEFFSHVGEIARVRVVTER